MIVSFRFAAVSLILVGTLGCGSDVNERVLLEVTGKVTHNDQPVTEGTVQFEDPAKGLGGSAELGEGGAYSTMLPEGSYTVTILPPTETIPDTENSPGGVEEKDVDNIPDKYRAPDTTDLKADIKPDALEHNFAMTS